MKICFEVDDTKNANDAFLEIHRLLPPDNYHYRIDGADVIVAIGGDGFMLDTIHRAIKFKVPIYGINTGTVGFLMNDYLPHLPGASDLVNRVTKAKEQIIRPLEMHVLDIYGVLHTALAVNEVSMIRSSLQAANLKVSVANSEKISNLACDGLLVATPAGSTAYNYAAGGPIIPVDAKALVLTPIAAFRPRGWSGAILPDEAGIFVEVLDSNKRPVFVCADSRKNYPASSVSVQLSTATEVKLLFDPGHSLEERIIREQFR